MVTRPVGGPDDFGMYRYTWSTGDYVSYQKKGSEIVVDYVKRVGNPRGSAGEMLAEAIRAGGNARPSALSAPNILQKDKNSDRVIETLMRQGVAALGGRVSDIHTGVDGSGKHWISVWVRYS